MTLFIQIHANSIIRWRLLDTSWAVHALGWRQHLGLRPTASCLDRLGLTQTYSGSRQPATSTLLEDYILTSRRFLALFTLVYINRCCEDVLDEG